jgi:proteasome lid subunit RPN8/RPN11
MNQTTNHDVTIYIPEDVFRSITLYSDLAIGEISWIGDIYTTQNIINVDNTYLLKQKTTDENTTLDNKSYAMFIMNYIKQGKDEANLKLWVHSHGIYPVSWSKKDVETIETHSRADYFVSIVVNKAGDILARVDIFKPFRITLNNVKVVVVPIIPAEVINEALANIEELVTYLPPEIKAAPKPTPRKVKRRHEFISSKRHIAPKRYWK